MGDIAERLRILADKKGVGHSSTKSLLEAADEIESLRDLLLEAIETIKVFHGPDAWDIYYENAPEMRRFRRASGCAVAKVEQ